MAVLRLLDVPHLDTGAGRTEVPPHKPALLLLHLAHEGTWVTREQLADLFWSEDRDGDARHNLRLLISRARKYSWASPLEVEPTRVRFLLQTDTHHFRDAVAREDWPAAITWYRKPFLAGLPSAGPPFDTWVSYEREALTGMWHKAMRSYAHDLSVTGRRAEAADLLHRLWRADVLAEDVLQAYLRAELAAGDRDAALRASATFRDVLHRDLGLTPMRETLDLEAALRQPASVPFERDERSSRRGSTFDSLPLVGRDRERTVLERERLVLVSGEPGVGKSRLLEEVMPSACWWRCVEGLDGVPYQPVLDALRGRPAALHVGPFTSDLAHLLPDMLGVSPPPSDPVTLKPRLLEALARATEASSDVLVVDDAQWSDAATLELLALPARRARMRLVVAYRLPEVDSNLTRLLRTLRDA